MSKKIGFDPGHGGWDPGAIGPTGLLEKDVTLAISLKVAEILRNSELKVILTRVRDTAVASVRDVRQELLARTYFLNAKKVDYAVSVHINSSTNRSANYISTFIQGRGGEAEKLADVVQTKLVQATGWPDGGVRVQNLHMTRETTMPAILVEYGFISNAEQEKQLRNPNVINKLAEAIATGILNYLGITPQAGGDEMSRLECTIDIKGRIFPGYLKDGVTYFTDAPVREVVEAINSTIEWDAKTKTVVIK